MARDEWTTENLNEYSLNGGCMSTANKQFKLFSNGWALRFLSFLLVAINKLHTICMLKMYSQGHLLVQMTISSKFKI